MHSCLLCKQEFAEKRGLNEHYNKKQSCISQKRILDLYKSLHKLVGYNIDYKNHEHKEEIDLIFETIQSTISNVELSPMYSKMLEFGKENTTLVKESFEKFEQLKENSFQMYVKELYCNPKSPENKVIRVTSMQGIFCQVFEEDEWIVECYENVMIKIMKNFWELMKVSENDHFQDYLMFIFEVAIKRNTLPTRKFITYCKRNILPLLYNETKRNKGFTYLIHKDKKKIKKNNKKTI